MLAAFITWVFILIIEVFWLMIDASGGVGNKEEIYVILIITLVVGATGLNLYSKHLKK